MSSPGLIPTFSTTVITWQCDENDHLNVQFYTEFGHEASAHLLQVSLGFGPRAQRAAGIATRAADDHVRYLREFRVVEPVEVHSASSRSATAIFVAYHEVRTTRPAASVAATIRRRIAAPSPGLPEKRARAEAAIVELATGGRQAAQRGQARPA